jgi:hypothetical protein
LEEDEEEVMLILRLKTTLDDASLRVGRKCELLTRKEREEQTAAEPRRPANPRRLFALTLELIVIREREKYAVKWNG